jgi:hypothetical protein
MSNLKPPVYRGAEGGRRAAEANPETSRGGEAGLKIRRENPVAEPGRRRSEPPPGRPWRRICCASACGALEEMVQALREFRQRYNQHWLVQRLNFRSPRQARQRLLALEAAA